MDGPAGGGGGGMNEVAVGPLPNCMGVPTLSMRVRASCFDRLCDRCSSPSSWTGGGKGIASGYDRQVTNVARARVLGFFVGEASLPGVSGLDTVALRARGTSGMARLMRDDLVDRSLPEFEREPPPPGVAMWESMMERLKPLSTVSGSATVVRGENCSGQQ